MEKECCHTCFDLNDKDEYECVNKSCSCHSKSTMSRDEVFLNYVRSILQEEDLSIDTLKDYIEVHKNNDELKLQVRWVIAQKAIVDAIHATEPNANVAEGDTK